jgi:cysteinyl-tRNA synthetase
VARQYGGDGLRIFVLSSHYRGPITFSEESLEAAKRGAERLRIAVSTPSSQADPPAHPEPFRERFLEAMDDDLNTAGALAALFDLAREINRARDEGRRADEAQASLREMAGIMGLTLTEPQAANRASAGPFIDLLVELRDELRAAKQYELSDRLRARLAEIGVILEDSSAGTRWRLKN